MSFALAQVSSLRARAQMRLPKDFFSSEFLSTQDKRGESNESKKCEYFYFFERLSKKYVNVCCDKIRQNDA